ncbi:uncharacterized protein LOC106166763 isoform X2 [Lingula anatina]|uniref:Uncharacterized protein LOC106166763 isoform X2 n=1 Tax=Lingula anatina TaxID=7574 RepID=A0A1S3ISF1_LINAN|nr:uncharacterized protein LOC106166763 isoform X2 [Lingula anatina]|eukprot:XP_013400866.1 uncharacterized protein LOC106166763 isoform X2 [Lingula anatina]
MPIDVRLDEIGPGMQDGDEILVEVLPGMCRSKHKLKIRFALGPHVTWWKGLVLRRKDQSGYRTIAELQDDQRPIEVEIDHVELYESDLLFSKAKLFGVHTDMYRLTDAEVVLKGGNQYNFTWIRDKAK